MLNDFPTHQELYWQAIGDDWEQPIGEMRVRVAGPGPIERVACFQGPFGSTLECERARINHGAARFVQEGLDGFTGMSIVAALLPGTASNALPIFEERWSLHRAFSVTPLTLVASLALLVAVVAGLSRFACRRGRDVRFSGSQVDQVMGGPPGGPTQAVPLFEDGNAPVEFAPPDDLRPGQVGTLIDEEANTLDVRPPSSTSPSGSSS